MGNATERLFPRAVQPRLHDLEESEGRVRQIGKLKHRQPHMREQAGLPITLPTTIENAASSRHNDFILTKAFT
jgi:hypothetical protein